MACVCRRFLVERSGNVRSFLQAYVVLVHSINTAKLQKWWTGAREGWTGSFATMASASYGYPAFFLRLYALDAAICEYCVLSSGAVLPSIADTAPAVLRRLNTTEERMEVVMEWAKDFGYARFDGVQESECNVCRDGGALICCEFCKISQHPGCCVPPVTELSKLKDWVCPGCVNDLAVLVNADDDDS